MQIQEQVLKSLESVNEGIAECPVYKAHVPSTSLDGMPAHGGSRFGQARAVYSQNLFSRASSTRDSMRRLMIPMI